MSRITMHNRPNREYKLLPYSPQWAKDYEKMAGQLKPVFGDNLVAIYHGGSTSIPGMIAKPQIDIYVAVKNLAKVQGIYKTMHSMGFQAFGDYIQVDEPEEYFAKDDDQGNRLFSVHVMQDGGTQIKKQLVFRDYLRTHNDAREAYSNLKLELRDKYSAQDYNAYGKGKNQFLTALVATAMEWDASGRSDQGAK